MAHIPVLQKEVIKYLDPKPNENFVDCTFGEGGHALAILEKNAPKGKVLGIDLSLKSDIKPSARLILVQDNFTNLKEIFQKYKFRQAYGILFDLGMSSWHLEESGRGFSFKRKEPLDMRYDAKSSLNAEKIINYWSKFEIEKIFREYGEERRAGRIAEFILEARRVRPIKNTLQLSTIVDKAGGDLRQVFQALRIAVNDELNNLKKALLQAQDLLMPGGRLVVISFHSLEDRIVKNFFSARGGSALGGKNQSFIVLTRKPIMPSFGEIRSNPRSRSAKLRAIQKL